MTPVGVGSLTVRRAPRSINAPSGRWQLSGPCGSARIHGMLQPIPAATGAAPCKSTEGIPR